MSKTINQALKDLYLSLGGDPSALEDNSTVSDYIADLENGLKGLAELPAPSSTNSGKIAKVVSDGEGGYIWGAENETSELPTPSVDNAGKVAKVVSDGQDGYIWSAENETQELPAVESTDINKLVGVVSDGASGAEYGLVSAPTSESDTFYIEINNATVSNFVWADFLEAVDNNKAIALKVSGNNSINGIDYVFTDEVILPCFGWRDNSSAMDRAYDFGFSNVWQKKSVSVSIALNEWTQTPTITVTTLS